MSIYDNYETNQQAIFCSSVNYQHIIEEHMEFNSYNRPEMKQYVIYIFEIFFVYQNCCCMIECTIIS